MNIEKILIFPLLGFYLLVLFFHNLINHDFFIENINFYNQLFEEKKDVDEDEEEDEEIEKDEKKDEDEKKNEEIEKYEYKYWDKFIKMKNNYSFEEDEIQKDELKEKRAEIRDERQENRQERKDDRSDPKPEQAQ